VWAKLPYVTIPSSTAANIQPQKLPQSIYSLPRKSELLTCPRTNCFKLWQSKKPSPPTSAPPTGWPSRCCRTREYIIGEMYLTPPNARSITPTNSKCPSKTQGISAFHLMLLVSNVNCVGKCMLAESPNGSMSSIGS